MSSRHPTPPTSNSTALNFFTLQYFFRYCINQKRISETTIFIICSTIKSEVKQAILNGDDERVEGLNGGGKAR